MNSKEIRKRFLDFFKEKKHKVVGSAPMVVKNDPTLMFTNAGMNQFKDIFLGDSKSKNVRLANSQKCLRVSGKHNDLEEVGVDTYHHTMFEMLGNWSFGDYFKKEAIHWAWELLTEVYKLDKSRLFVTVFGGDRKDQLTEDSETLEIWKKIIDVNQILLFDKKDNFWEMGTSGPCGPCSEIHIDLRDNSDRKKKNARLLVNKSHPLVIEIWNLVFMEYNRKSDGSLEALTKRHIDTGLGLERLAMVLQGKKSNYDTDVFSPLVKELETISGFYYAEELDKMDKKQESLNVAIRVIVDHIRAISFSISDGQLPSNTGAGYVIRRILRRALRYGYQILDLKEPFLHELVKVLAEQFDGVYHEIIKQKKFIEKVVLEEEVSFYRTLEQGMKKMDLIVLNLKGNKKKSISGKDVFDLYDRFGFPVDLTKLIATEHKLTINETEFNSFLDEQKNRSKKAAALEISDWIELKEEEKNEFVGYDHLEIDVFITRYRSIKEKGKTNYQLVFNRTPFYPEGGGQVGDTGFIIQGENKTKIIDTKKENNLILHFCKDLPKSLDGKFQSVVNKEKRALTANNHTATHLLHFALRKVLGDHVEQKGSYVNDKYLRFDFSHYVKMTDEDLNKVEVLVNQYIRYNYSLEETRKMNVKKAIELGAMMLFGEKYGEVVRVIKFGESIELCGGIHVSSTSLIGNFKITSESSIAAGVRRVEAITSITADSFLNEKLELLDKVNGLLKNPNNILKSVKDLIKENASLQKKIENLNKNKVGVLKENLIAQKKNINGVSFIAAKIDLDSPSIKRLAFDLKNEIENLFLVLGSEYNGKAILTVMISENIVDQRKLHAGNIVNSLSKEIEGGGGGQSFFATAGGKNINGINIALTKAIKFID